MWQPMGNILSLREAYSSLHPGAEGAGEMPRITEVCLCVFERTEGQEPQSRRGGQGNGVGVGAEDGCGAYTTLNLQYDLSLTLNDKNGKILIRCSFGLVPSWTRKKEKQISNYLQPMEDYSENK